MEYQITVATLHNTASILKLTARLEMTPDFDKAVRWTGHTSKHKVVSMMHSQILKLPLASTVESVQTRPTKCVLQKEYMWGCMIDRL